MFCKINPNKGAIFSNSTTLRHLTRFQIPFRNASATSYLYFLPANKRPIMSMNALVREIPLFLHSCLQNS